MGDGKWKFEQFGFEKSYSLYVVRVKHVCHGSHVCWSSQSLPRNDFRKAFQDAACHRGGNAPPPITWLSSPRIHTSSPRYHHLGIINWVTPMSKNANVNQTPKSQIE